MNPNTHRLLQSPRNLGADAFFTADRSATAVTRSVRQIEVDANAGDKAGTETSVSFGGFLNKHVLVSPDPQADNPLPHTRMLPKGAGVDPAVAGWKHTVRYRCFFSKAARALSATASEQARLQVKIFHGTGTEPFRHGVCGMVEDAPDPSLVIFVPGIEPSYKIEFWNPDDPTQKRELVANTRWGISITRATIEGVISRRYGRLISYDVTVCAGYSTGYLGVQGAIAAGLFPIDRLQRLIFFDCLYATVRPAVDKVRSTTPGAQVIAYVISEGGNSFREKGEKAIFSTLVLGGIPGWNYINLMGNPTYHAIASARVVNEGRSATAPIIDSLPADYEKALNDLVALLPDRGRLISKKSGVPTGAISLAGFAADKAKAAAASAFFDAKGRSVGMTRRCLRRAQLLGWPTPPGEEWHDLVLIEFAWEYLT
jgi:hypothetical protein